jgi:WXXGXW repeat (2 copies)
MWGLRMKRSLFVSTPSRRRLLTGMAAALGFTVAGASSTRADAVVVLRPPPLRYEPIPVPPGPPDAWIWLPGRWAWNGGRYVWIPGYYVRRMRSYSAWVPGHWVPRGGGWVWVEGHWR